MKPGARQDPGETARLDQTREEAIEALRGCTSFVLVTESEEGSGLGSLIGSLETEVLFCAWLAIGEKLAELLQGGDDE